MRRVLILQAGSTHPAVRARFGDYGDWFARLVAPRAACRVIRAWEEKLPDLAGFDGVLMTGSPRSVTEPEPWIDEAAGYMLDAARTRAVLGVCFGHQLLARALGGRVERNPRGREAGTTEVSLTEDGARDPLFAGVPGTTARTGVDGRPAGEPGTARAGEPGTGPRTILVQQTHEDHVAELPPGASLLATNSMSQVQAYAVGDAVRCVQFHPEMDAERSRLLAEVRRERLDQQAPGGARLVLASIRVTPDGERVLVNWLARFVGASA
jgi:GMP synthase (glutamine-hydrolysing)